MLALEKTSCTTGVYVRKHWRQAVTAIAINAHLLSVNCFIVKEVWSRYLQLRAYAISPNTSMLKAPARANLTRGHCGGNFARLLPK